MCLIVATYKDIRRVNNELTAYLHQTLPPIILKAGVPLMRQSRANNISQFGQVQGV